MVYGKLLNTQPGTPYKMHLSRWPTTTVRATVPCREGLRPGAALLHLWYGRLGSGSECNMRLDMAVFAWGHMMHEQDASAHLVPSCNAGKGG